MNKINEITSGKAKSLYTTDNENHLIMNFRDDTSAFDGKKKEALLGKGAVNNQFNAFILEHLENNNVPTHHIKVLNQTDSLVHKLEMFPIECVIRNIASGSICSCFAHPNEIMCSSFISGSPKSSSFKKNSKSGDCNTKPSSVPSLRQIDPEAIFLITHSIGNISSLWTNESV